MRIDIVSEHADPATVRAHPGRSVAHAPQVFLHAVITYLETAWTVPAKGKFPAAGVTLETAFWPPGPF